MPTNTCFLPQIKPVRSRLFGKNLPRTNCVRRTFSYISALLHDEHRMHVIYPAAILMDEWSDLRLQTSHKCIELNVCGLSWVSEAGY